MLGLRAGRELLHHGEVRAGKAGSEGPVEERTAGICKGPCTTSGTLAGAGGEEEGVYPF